MLFRIPKSALLLLLAPAIMMAFQGKDDEKAKEAKPQPVHLTGMVFDQDHKGVRNAVVTIEGPKLAKKEDTRTTASGSYTFAVPPGNYRVTAVAEGKSKSQMVDVKQSQTAPPFTLDIE